jgi:hypothetical protein
MSKAKNSKPSLDPFINDKGNTTPILAIKNGVEPDKFEDYAKNVKHWTFPDSYHYTEDKKFAHIGSIDDCRFCRRAQGSKTTEEVKPESKLESEDQPTIEAEVDKDVKSDKTLEDADSEVKKPKRGRRGRFVSTKGEGS